VDLQKFFGNITVISIQETTLTANQLKPVPKLRWKVETSLSERTLKHRDDVANLIYTLNPMETRTFVVRLSH
jgi:hypothetical protein